MATFYQTIIQVISKPSESRNEDEINLVLGWFMNLFKKKEAAFGNIKAEIVKDIIKNCSFVTKKPDELIIRQGDIGDAFYINLRGKVSVYINHKKHDENDNVDDEQQHEGDAIDEHDPTLDALRAKRLREKLGNFVLSLGAGEGFGEFALVRDEARTASIIADEMTDLMVVNKKLYDRLTINLYNFVLK